MNRRKLSATVSIASIGLLAAMLSGCAAPAGDVPAAGPAAELRAEYGDRLPVVLVDDDEHSCWEVDDDELRADLASPEPFSG